MAMLIAMAKAKAEAESRQPFRDARQPLPAGACCWGVAVQPGPHFFASGFGGQQGPFWKGFSLDFINSTKGRKTLRRIVYNALFNRERSWGPLRSLGVVWFLNDGGRPFKAGPVMLYKAADSGAYDLAVLRKDQMCARKSAMDPTDFDTYAVQNKEDVLERTMKVYRAMGMRFVNTWSKYYKPEHAVRIKRILTKKLTAALKYEKSKYEKDKLRLNMCIRVPERTMHYTSAGYTVIKSSGVQTPMDMVTIPRFDL
jgi:hypothetical protein